MLKPILKVDGTLYYKFLILSILQNACNAKKLARLIDSCLAVELARRTDNCSFIPPDITYKVLIFSSNLSMNSLKE